MQILITSGGTKVPIDEVREIANFSKGGAGCGIALAALKDGHDTVLLHADDAKVPHKMIVDVGVDPWDGGSERDLLEDFRSIIDRHALMRKQARRYLPDAYHTFDEYAAKLKEKMEHDPHIAFLAAAVSDFGVTPVAGKIASDAKDMSISLHGLPKLIRSMKSWSKGTFLVGFKLLVNATIEQREEEATKQIDKAFSDVVLVNDLSDLRIHHHQYWMFARDFDGTMLMWHIEPGPDLYDKVFAAVLQVRVWKQCGTLMKNFNLVGTE